jgi:PAS domain S-box-containing protein
VTGYRAEDMIGKPDAFQLLSRSPKPGADRDGGSLGGARVEERPINCKDGTVRYVEWLPMAQDMPLSGWTQCWVGIDVTERREAIERLAGLFHSSSEALGFWTLEGKLLEVNRAFLDLTGYTKDELLRQSYHILLSPEYRGRHAEIMEQVIKTGQPGTFDKEYVRKDGTRVGVSATIFLVRGLAGKPIGLGSIVKQRGEE